MRIIRAIIYILPISFKVSVKSIIYFIFRLFPNGLLFKALPLSTSLLLIKKISPLADIFPHGRGIIFREYLGNIHLHIDTFYPMEKTLLKGYYEPETFSIIERFVKRGNVCLDIGANFGAITLALAQKVQPEGTVFAFEPGGVTFKRLQHNILLNPDFKNIIHPIQLGISDKEGVMYWREDKNYPGNASLINVQEPGSEVISITTIDQYCRQHQVDHIDFIKADVESMEYEVIKGSLETLQKHSPILYYETMPEFEQYRNMPVFLYIERLLKEIDYRLFKVMENGEIVETTYPDLSDYTLALSKHMKLCVLE